MTSPTRAGDKSTTPRYGVTLPRWETGFAGEHGLVEKDLSRGEAHNYSMEARSDPFESAKSHLFDTSSWGEFCDVTLTLKQAWQPDRGGWVKIDDYRCRQAFRHFINLLNRAVYGSAFRRHGKRLRVLPVLEKGEVRARALRPWECGASGRWHIHCAIELPSHFDAITLENMIRECWAKVEWGHGRILVRDGANAGWIDYMLKDRQKSESVRRLQAGLQSFLSMRRIDARRKNAKAFRLKHSQSLAKRRQRLSHAMVRSTIQRLGKTTKPLT